MAKVELNGALQHLRGAVGAFVYRNTKDGVCVSRRPTFHHEPSVEQQTTRNTFRAAAAYAKSALRDATLGPRYAAAAQAAQMPAYRLALRDSMTPPSVTRIDASGFHGRIGDLIEIVADDDFEVAAVSVVIRADAGDALMQGEAMPIGGSWIYAATATVPLGQPITIEAVATDRPGHTGRRTLRGIVT